MGICGYVPMSPHGFALPVYRSNADKANALYVAIAEIEGDRLAPIADFKIFNALKVLPFHDDVEVITGSLWQDVFLWKDKVFVGPAALISEQLSPFYPKIARTAPPYTARPGFGEQLSGYTFFSSNR